MQEVQSKIIQHSIAGRCNLPLSSLWPFTSSLSDLGDKIAAVSSCVSEVVEIIPDFNLNAGFYNCLRITWEFCDTGTALEEGMQGIRLLTPWGRVPGGRLEGGRPGAKGMKDKTGNKISDRARGPNSASLRQTVSLKISGWVILEFGSGA